MPATAAAAIVRPSGPRAARRAAIAIVAIGGATIAGALAFQHLGGLTPCPLCLQQRWPYYVGLPIALIAVPLLPRRAIPAAIALGIVAAIFCGSAAFGAWHAGVEWGWFAGPADCAASGAPTAGGGMGDFLRSLETAKPVSCSEAAFRFAGVSLAGWNALISLGLAALAAYGARAASRPGRAG